MWRVFSVAMPQGVLVVALQPERLECRTSGAGDQEGRSSDRAAGLDDQLSDEVGADNAGHCTDDDCARLHDSSWVFFSSNEQKLIVL